MTGSSKILKLNEDYIWIEWHRKQTMPLRHRLCFTLIVSRFLKRLMSLKWKSKQIIDWREEKSWKGASVLSTNVCRTERRWGWRWRAESRAREVGKCWKSLVSQEWRCKGSGRRWRTNVPSSAIKIPAWFLRSEAPGWQSGGICRCIFQTPAESLAVRALCPPAHSLCLELLLSSLVFQEDHLSWLDGCFLTVLYNQGKWKSVRYDTAFVVIYNQEIYWPQSGKTRE